MGKHVTLSIDTASISMCLPFRAYMDGKSSIYNCLLNIIILQQEYCETIAGNEVAVLAADGALQNKVDETQYNDTICQLYRVGYTEPPHIFLILSAISKILQFTGGLVSFSILVYRSFRTKISFKF